MTIDRVRHLCRSRRGTPALCTLLIALTALGGVHQVSASSAPTEREVKAAFVYNFAKFVEFPPGTFANADSPIVIGVLDDTQMADSVEKLVKGKSANGRKLEVKRFSKVSQCNSCQVLLVGAGHGDRVSDVIDRVKGAGVLTIGEADGFARRGGIIGFVVESSKVGFEINVAVAKKEGIKISSKLLSLAKARIG